MSSGKDLCVEGGHGCQHQCVSALGTFHCACNPGYQLAEDNKSCLGESCPCLCSLTAPESSVAPYCPSIRPVSLERPLEVKVQHLYGSKKGKLLPAVTQFLGEILTPQLSVLSTSFSPLFQACVLPGSNTPPKLVCECSRAHLLTVSVMQTLTFGVFS